MQFCIAAESQVSEGNTCKRTPHKVNQQEHSTLYCNIWLQQQLT